MIPRGYSEELAEFFGIMLGDGHVSHFQVVISLGNKDIEYIKHVTSLVSRIFKAPVKTSIRKRGYRDVYISSTAITSWLLKKGLVSNKVKIQVGMPKWILRRKSYMKAFIRGFFDTDGCVYKIKHRIQIDFTNRSIPLLRGLQKILAVLGYNVSDISVFKIYLTRKRDVKKFFKNIQPRNQKHRKRFEEYASVG